MKTGRDKRKKKSTLSVLFFMALGLIYSLYQSNRHANKLKEYNSIFSINEVNWVVGDFWEYRGSIYFEQNGIKIYILHSSNDLLKPNNLCDFLKKRDLLIKEKDSDFVIICRDNLDYVFRIGDIYYKETPRSCSHSP